MNKYAGERTKSCLSFINFALNNLIIMPYRRLPTTDKARTRALETALEKVAFKNLMVLGGTKVGYHAARRLSKKYRIKLIEAEKGRCFETPKVFDQTVGWQDGQTGVIHIAEIHGDKFIWPIF